MEIWKPHVELGGGEWERSQSTSAVVTRNVKDALPNQGPLSITQPLLPLNSLPKNSTTAGNKKKQQLHKWYCVFCYNNARFTYEKGGIVLHPQLDGPWQTHVCKDSNGLVICPVLAAHVCRYCGATGIFAHTEKYCNSEKKRSLHVMSLRRID
ncbi:Nanos RNA binding domain family protein [Acanthocheilonema viteae]